MLPIPAFLFYNTTLAAYPDLEAAKFFAFVLSLDSAGNNDEGTSLFVEARQISFEDDSSGGIV